MFESWFRSPSYRLGRRDISAARRAVWLMLLAVLPIGAQSGASGMRIPSPQTIGQHTGTGLDDIWGDPADQQKRLSALNAARQKSILDDTAKLVKLAAELKAETDSASPEDTLPQQMRQWAQIEKLAHGIKDKMSYAMQAPPVYTPYGVAQ
jgi:hypothetical protein